MKLSARHIKFIDEYIKNPNSSAAARLAGYAESSARVTAHRLLLDIGIKKAIAIKRNELALKYEISKHTVVKELLGAVAMAREKKDAGSMIRAWVEIAKIMGFYAPNIENKITESDNNVLHQLEALSDDELMTIVNGNKK